MAKRASILSANYNPVGERLKQFLRPAAVIEPQTVSPGQTVVDLPRPVVDAERPSPERLRSSPQREPIPDVPTDRELMTVSVRFRCTLSERRKWHEITRELSGDHNTLSHFVRAAMLLLEHAYEPLQRLAPDIRRSPKPSNVDSLGIALYEQRLSQYLYDAIRGAGRPKG